MLLEILHYPNPKLRNIAKNVAVFDETIAKLAADMLETMYHKNGIGLAAIQVGIALRIAVIDISEERNQAQIFINPTLTKISNEQNIYEEGCLSVPGIQEKVARPSIVSIQAQNLQGELFTVQADGLLATCIQHEIDHLNGKVFIDRISGMKKNIIDRKIKKYKYS
jgi:peptide deformylase